MEVCCGWLTSQEMVGCDVTLHHLVGRPELNGRHGTVHTSEPGGGRVGVRIDGEPRPLALKLINLKHKGQALIEESTMLLEQKQYCRARSLLVSARELLSAWPGPLQSQWGRLWGLAHFQLARVADEQAYNGFSGLTDGVIDRDDEDGLTSEDLDDALQACVVAISSYEAHFGDAHCSQCGDTRALQNNLQIIAREVSTRIAVACEAAPSRTPTRQRDRWLWARLRQLRELPRDRTDGSSRWRDERYLTLYFSCDDGSAPDLEHGRDWKNALSGLNLWMTGPWVGPLSSHDRADLEEFQREHNLDGLYPPVDYTLTCPGCECAVGEFGFLCLEYMTVMPGGLPSSPVVLSPPGVERPTVHTGYNRIVHRLWCPSCCKRVLDAALSRTIQRFGLDALARSSRHTEGECTSEEANRKALELIQLPPWTMSDLRPHGYRSCFGLKDAIIRTQAADNSLEDRIYYTVAKDHHEFGGGTHMHDAETAVNSFHGPAGCTKCKWRHLDRTQGNVSSLPPKLKRCAGCDGTPYLGPWYCSVECQQAHWPEHKSNCRSRLAR